MLALFLKKFSAFKRFVHETVTSPSGISVESYMHYYPKMKEHLYAMIIVITYNFITLKTSFFINPTCPRYILHILHGHPSETYLLILSLKPLRDLDFLFHWVLSPICLDLDRHRFSAMSNRIYSPSLKRIVITKVIRTHFWSKNFFHNFRCNIIFNFEHLSR